ncbi:MAG: hypothetical protein ABSC22_07795 [Roseiarcus sp.]|jgi:hypothetical protein
MLIARRPLGKALLARSRVYELAENGSAIGTIEHGAARDIVDIGDRRFFIVAQRKRSLFESIVKTLMRLFKESYVFRDQSGTIIATAEKNAVNDFFLGYEGATYEVRPLRGVSLERGVEVRKQGARAAIGDVRYHGVAVQELASSLPESWSLPVRAFVIWMLIYRIANARDISG